MFYNSFSISYNFYRNKNLKKKGGQERIKRIEKANRIVIFFTIVFIIS